MRYRALSATGDSTFGSGSTAFFVNNAAAVGQAIKTRLLLMQGEWFLDVTVGTPWSTKILGRGTAPTYDAALRETILGTDGVVSIVSYSSNLNRAKRLLTVQATVATLYGEVTVNVDIPTVAPR